VPSPEGVVEALGHVRRRIESAGGDPTTVRVIAVTKGFGADAVEAALAAGLSDIGENYGQELVIKHAALGPGADRARWHFLGAVQRNKVRVLAPLVDCWQGVARLSEGAEIARRAAGATVLVEMDTTGSPGRNGCPPGEVPGLVGALGELGLRVAGLMTVASPDPETAAQAFRTVREVADRLGLDQRSMGMTGDLELAVAEGSTMVRVGRALFGDRPPRRPGR
jgi:hypothetical protein